MALTRLERKLVTDGYDKFTLEEKNLFLQEIARKLGKPVNEISDEVVLDYHKQIKKSTFSSECQKTIRQGFTCSSTGDTYRTDYDDQINFIGKMLQLIHDDTISTVHWKTVNAGYKEHTREEWIDVFTEALGHKEAALFRYDSLLDEVGKAGTHEDLIKLQWEEETEEEETEEEEPKAE